MSTNADDFHELLNGLLDGVLTDDEQRQLDIAMKEDPSLEDRLNELQAMRNSLLRGRSVGRLGPEFSQGVVAAARKRAEMMGDRAPAWLRPPVQRSADRVAKRIPQSPPSPVRTETKSREYETTRIESTRIESIEASSEAILSRRAWRVWIPTLTMAVAASFMVYFSVNYWAPRSSVQPLVSNIPLPGEFDPADPETNHLAVEMLPSESAKVASSDAPMPSHESPVEASQRVASPDTPSANNDASRLAADEKTRGSLESPTDAPMVVPMVVPMVERSAPVGELAVVAPDVEQPTNPIQDLLQSKGVTDPIFTLLADVSIDPEAQQKESLRSLMEEHDIVVADDLNLSQEQLDALIASRIVGSLSPGTESQQSKDVQVLFVRARATRIDAFLVDIERQYKDFPNYRLDMSFDPTVLQLTKQLSSVVTASDAARRLAFRDTEQLGLVTAFPAGGREVQYVGIDARKQLSEQSGAPKLKSPDTTSYLILLVRNMPDSGQ
jgi:hypothetical protein